VPCDLTYLTTAPSPQLPPSLGIVGGGSGPDGKSHSFIVVRRQTPSWVFIFPPSCTRAIIVLYNITYYTIYTLHHIIILTHTLLYAFARVLYTTRAHTNIYSRYLLCVYNIIIYIIYMYLGGGSWNMYFYKRTHRVFIRNEWRQRTIPKYVYGRHTLTHRCMYDGLYGGGQYPRAHSAREEIPPPPTPRPSRCDANRPGVHLYTVCVNIYIYIYIYRKL